MLKTHTCIKPPKCIYVYTHKYIFKYIYLCEYMHAYIHTHIYTADLILQQQPPCEGGVALSRRNTPR